MQYTELFQKTKVLAVIGCSDKPGRAGHDIPRMMNQNGYDIIPVNPNITSALNIKAFPSMLDIPEELQIDIVVIFRNPKYTAGAVGDILRWAKHLEDKPLIWTQPGVSTSQAKSIAENAGYEYVENACIAVEYAKYGK